MPTHSSGQPAEATSQTLAALRQRLEALTLAAPEREAVSAVLQELGQACQKLEAQTSHYQALFEQMPEGYLVTDGAGVILEANQAAAVLLGLRPAELAGRPLLEFVTEDLRGVFQMWLGRLQAGGEACRQEAVVNLDLTLRPAAGSPFSAGLAVQRLCAGGDKLKGLGWQFHDLTRYKLAEEALASGEARLTLALEAAREGLYDYRIALDRMYFSPTYYTMLGYEPGAFPAGLASLKALVHPDDWAAVRQVFAGDLAAPRNTYAMEFRMRTKGGEWRWLVGQGRVLERDAQGRPLRIIGTNRDITDRKQTEKMLLEREELYRAMFEKNQAIKLLLDPENGAIVAANQAAADFYGYACDQLQSMHIGDINTLPPERVREELQRAASEERLQFTFQHRLASGEVRDVEVYTGPIDIQGRRLLFSIIHDITERKRAEEALRESELKQRALIDAIPDMMFMLSADGVFLDYHAPASHALLLPPEQFLGQPMQAVLPPELGKFAQGFEALIQQGGIQLHEYTLSMDGQLRYYEARFVACGEHRILSIVRDITKRKQAEAEIHRLNEDLERRVKERTAEYEAAIIRLEDQITKNLRVELELRASEQQYRTLIETSPDGILVSDLQGNLRMVNMQTVALFGYANAREMLKHKVFDFLAPADQPRLLDHLQQVLAGATSQSVEYLALKEGGAAFDAEINISLVGERKGAPQGFLCVTRDITKRKQIEAEVRRLNEDLERRVAERTRELEALYKVTTLGGEPLNLQTILERSLALVLETLGAQAGMIHLLEVSGAAHPEAPLLRLTAYRGLTAAAAASIETLPAGAGLASQIVQSGKPVVSLDVSAEGRALHPSLIGDYHAFVGAPMRVRGQRTLGVLSVFSRGELEVSLEAVSLLTSIADQLGGIVDNARLRRQAETAAVMEERQRLARELHDSVTQALYSLALIAAAGKNLAHTGDLARLEQHLDTINETARLALREMRLLIHALRPLILEQVGLVEALRQRLGAVEERVGLKARLLVDGNLEIPAALESQLYSMALETLNNSLKHAHATQVTVRLIGESDYVVLEVDDDGQGFDPRQAILGGGLGLTSLRERVEKLDGELAIQSSPGGGSQVRVKVSRREREGGRTDAL